MTQSQKICTVPTQAWSGTKFYSSCHCTPPSHPSHRCYFLLLPWYSFRDTHLQLNCPSPLLPNWKAREEVKKNKCMEGRCCFRPSPAHFGKQVLQPALGGQVYFTSTRSNSRCYYILNAYLDHPYTKCLGDSEFIRSVICLPKICCFSVSFQL